MNWYLEIYKKTGRKAERHWLESDFSVVVGHVKAARRDPDHILRVMGPYDAPRAQIHELERLGARPTFA
jgi:hypothetical protein